MTTWIKDENGNRASVEKWGDEEAARASLKTLKDCSDCSDCSYCSDCSRCSGKNNVAAGEVFEFSIPKIDNIHQKIYAAVKQPDALDMRDVHTCKTTHCRAGWVVELAGEAGKALESRFNWELAAMLIYRESGSPINPARFYDSNEDALADMKRLADEEAARAA